jgi:hypothetical protein
MTLNQFKDQRAVNYYILCNLSMQMNKTVTDHKDQLHHLDTMDIFSQKPGGGIMIRYNKVREFPTLIDSYSIQ